MPEFDRPTHGAEPVEPIHERGSFAEAQLTGGGDGVVAEDTVEGEPDIDDQFPEGANAGNEDETTEGDRNSASRFVVAASVSDGGTSGERPITARITDGKDAEPESAQEASDTETPADRPRLTPLGVANELFETAGPEVGGVLYHPETVDDYRLHSIYSMAALAEVEHEALAAGQQQLPTEGIVTGQDRVEEYNVDDYQGTRVPLPGANVIADYVERTDLEADELEYIVKVQPDTPMPDFDAPDLTLQQAMAMQAKYEQDLADRPEIIWESATAHRIRVLQGGEEKDIESLPIGQIVETARFLRTAAIRAAVGRKNFGVLERILPHDPDIPTPITGIPRMTE